MEMNTGVNVEMDGDMYPKHESVTSTDVKRWRGACGETCVDFLQIFSLSFCSFLSRKVSGYLTVLQC